MSASVSATLVTTSPAATSVTLPNLQASYPAPVAAQALLSPIVVQPAGWSGTLALSGPDASHVMIVPDPLGGFDLKVGFSAITSPQSYNFTVTATP